MSESQERMCAVVEPAKLDRVLAICAKWGVNATVIGEVTGTGRLEISWRGEQIVDVPPRTVAHEGPVYDRPMARPADLDALQADLPDRLPRPSTVDGLRETLLRMVSSPNLADKRWVTDQYDRYVQGNTVLAQPEDAGIVRLDERSRLGIALATDGNGRYARLDPYAGAQLALAEAYRNVAATGATPVAVTDCLNFGSPEDPGVMWQFAEAVRGLADGCATLGMPVTGGNVSFYNQTGTAPIHPTPVIGVLGLLDDVARRTPIDFGADGDVLLLLGDTRDEFGGSEWAWVEHGHLGGRPPAVDLDRERLLAELLVSGASRRPAAGRARPVRRRARPGTGRVVPGRSHRRDGASPGRDRSVRGALLRVRRARGGRGGSGRRGALCRALPGAGHAVRAGRRRRRRRPRGGRRLRRAAGRTPGGARVAVARTLRLTRTGRSRQIPWR